MERDLLSLPTEGALQAWGTSFLHHILLQSTCPSIPCSSLNWPKHNTLLSKCLGLISLFFLAHMLKFFQTDGLKWKLQPYQLCPKQMPHNHNHINKIGKSEYEECERREKKINNFQNVSADWMLLLSDRFPWELWKWPFPIYTPSHSFYLIFFTVRVGEGRENAGIFAGIFLDFTTLDCTDFQLCLT